MSIVTSTFLFIALCLLLKTEIRLSGFRFSIVAKKNVTCPARLIRKLKNSFVNPNWPLRMSSIELLTLFIVPNCKPFNWILPIKFRWWHAFQVILLESHILAGQPSQCRRWNLFNSSEYYSDIHQT